jgi:RimJ/RimL family protein N-acetyltransferase
MDSITDHVEVLNNQREPEHHDSIILAEFDKWRVRELILTQEKALFLWTESNKYKALFSDFTLGDVANFSRGLLASDSLWYEVIDESDELVGVLSVTELNRITDCEVHVLFFDHKLQEKAPLCRQMIEHIFKIYPLRRMTVTIPSICFALIRWAKKVGFQEEGRKRDSLLMGNRWVDQVILGILRQEVV